MDADHSLYQLLLKTDIRVAGEISNKLSLLQDGKLITVERAKSNLHIDEDQEPLQIYVPANKDDRECCYLMELPRQLLSVFGVPNSAGDRVICAILQASSPSVLDRLLETEGIGCVPGIEPVAQDTFNDYESQAVHIDASETRSSSTTVIGSSDGGLNATDHRATLSYQQVQLTHRMHDGTANSSVHSLAGGTHIYEPWPDQLSTELPTTPLRHLQFHSTGSANPQETGGGSSSGEYHKLLDNIIKRASTVSLSDQGFFDFEAMLGSLPSNPGSSPDHDAISGVRSQNQIAHDIKVSAAGELFVRRYLCKSFAHVKLMPCP
jgi:hypothetical protein